jgi:hypothetical protein
MIWLSWRLQRSETILALAGLVLLAALFVPEGLQVAVAYTHYGIAACAGKQTRACEVAFGAFGDNAGALRGGLGWFNLLPGLIGVALAAPLVLELENGTSVFAWTQGNTRARWLAAKVGVAMGTAVVAATAYSLLIGWARGPLDTVFGRFSNSVFDFEGIVPIAYFLFALGLGLAVGVVLRRTAPAMVVAFLAYFGARISTDTWLRQHFVTPLAVTWGPKVRGTGPMTTLDRAWILSEGPSNRAGIPFSGSFAALQRCASSSPGGLKSLNQACMTRIGAGYNHAVYQPDSRFWEFQGIEFALFAGLALLLISFAGWRVLRTD